MKISIEDVRYVAQLARLRVSPEEEARFVGQLDSILQYVGKLNELDTADVLPTSHAIDLDPLFRDDFVTSVPDAERLLENAPDRSESFFRVPKIIES